MELEIPKQPQYHHIYFHHFKSSPVKWYGLSYSTQTQATQYIFGLLGALNDS